jgi:hypothetical protein
MMTGHAGSLSGRNPNREPVQCVAPKFAARRHALRVFGDMRHLFIFLYLHMVVVGHRPGGVISRNSFGWLLTASAAKARQ